VASISSLASSLFIGRPQAGSAGLFAAARSQQAAALPTTTARTQQLKAAQAVEAQQLAVTKGLQSLATALEDMTFTEAGVAGEREEIREDRIRFESRSVYRTESVYARELVTATRNLTERRNLTEARDIISQRPLYETRDIIETRDVFETRDITETRDIFETRDITETRDIYETRDIIETRDVFETRDIIETRDIVETRPVYEQQEVRQTLVTGATDLSAFSRFSDAGISNGSEFTVQAGTGSTAVVRFQNATRIRVTVDGNTTNFDFTSNDGSWRTALVSALNSVDGVNASIDSGGQLAIEAEGAEDLVLANQTGTPLASLGLAAGTTSSSVVGYEDVQVGTEDVVVGTEDVVIGTEDVLVGTEDMVVGTEDVLIGTEDVVIGTEDVLIGTEDVVIGTEDVLIGTEDVVVGTEDIEVGTEDYVSGSETVVIGSETVVVGTQTYVAGSREVVAGSRGVFDHLEQVDTGIVDSVLIGFTRAIVSDQSQIATSGSRRAVLEAGLSLDTAIGRDIPDNPFAALRGTVDLDELLTLASSEARDAALKRISTALEVMTKSAANTSMATLVLAGIDTGLGPRANPLAYATTGTPASTLRRLA
jgi:hypothetical protein